MRPKLVSGGTGRQRIINTRKRGRIREVKVCRRDSFRRIGEGFGASWRASAEQQLLNFHDDGMPARPQNAKAFSTGYNRDAPAYT